MVLEQLLEGVSSNLATLNEHDNLFVGEKNGLAVIKESDTVFVGSGLGGVKGRLL